MNQTNILEKTDKQEIAEVLEMYRECPENKKAIVIAFIQGMEMQKTISIITSKDCGKAV